MKDKTNWNHYYKKKSIVSTYAQGIQRKYILAMLKKNVKMKKIKNIVELGGADSCFYETAKKIFPLKSFCIIDNSIVGLENFKKLHQGEGVEIKLSNCDLLNDKVEIEKADLCYSLGLIEHFNKKNTAKVIGAHFDCVQPNGYTMISFPTPTFKYRTVRRIMEILGVWQFWDERPLLCGEVEKVIKNYGVIVDKCLMKRMPLTQMLYLIKKK